MKRRKYPYMIVGGDMLCIGMEGPNGLKASARISWAEVEQAKLDVVDVNLDILEHQIDKIIGGDHG